MQHRENPEDAGALDGALLELMLDHPRPWSEAELARTTSLPGDIPSVLARLSYDGLVNRWGDLASPTFAAARFSGYTMTAPSPTSSAATSLRSWKLFWPAIAAAESR